MEFEKYLSIVSYLFTNKTIMSVWYLDSGASYHMMEAWELFKSLMEKDLGIHVELGDDVKYAMKGQ
jgi:hypothetical protein